MISGEAIRAARSRARMSQQELAQRVGVSLRTVGNWERGESVPRNREQALIDVLGELDPSVSVAPSPLEHIPDGQLLLEVARRFTMGELAKAELAVVRSQLDIAQLPPPTPDEVAQHQARTVEVLEQFIENEEKQPSPDIGTLRELEKRLAEARNSAGLSNVSDVDESLDEAALETEPGLDELPGGSEPNE